MTSAIQSSFDKLHDREIYHKYFPVMINNLDTEPPSCSPLWLETKQAQVKRTTPAEIPLTGFFFRIPF